MSMFKRRATADYESTRLWATCFWTWPSRILLARFSYFAGKPTAAEQTDSASSSETPEAPAPSRCSQTWAMRIKRVYEIDTLTCSQCGGQMKVIFFIEPPQGAVSRRFCVTAGYGIR